jgi:flagellar hook protein FlgE
MSLSSSLNAGVAGLSVNSTRLAVISDNIANSSTNGYRRADVDFAALVTPSGSNSFSAGGVTVATYRDVTTAGALISTGNATDISVAGRGMLPVTKAESVGLGPLERPFQMVATGAFTRDEAGYLLTRSGLALLGWPTDADGALVGPVVRESPASLEPVQISPFLTVSEPTTTMTLGVNLPASETEAGAAGDPFETTLGYFDSVGRDNLMRVAFTPVVPATGASNQWRMSFYDSATSDTIPVAEIDLEFDATRGGRGSLLSVTPLAGVPYDATTGTAQGTVADGPIDVFIGGPAGNLQTLRIND